MKTRKQVIIRARNGCYYDADAVECCPHGGGFVVKIPADEIEEWDCQIPSEYRLTKVGFDGPPFFEAYIDPRERWNGWQLPWMTREQAEVFFANEAALCKAYPDCRYVQGRFDGEELVTWIPGEGDEDRMGPAIISVGGKEKKVYDVGLGLTWDEWTEEEIRQYNEAHGETTDE